jgi:BirA family transcriptional regulator, biotin operon repressor / biotin---[acetyl-CoA-carboxylase] ligase
MPRATGTDDPMPGRPAAAPALATWHGRSPAEWRERWRIPELLIFRTVGSTNDEARALAEAGAPAGTVVLAEAQTRGRGRRGRGWYAQPGESLLLSIVLRADRTGRADLPGVLPLRVGIATARAIEAVTGLGAGIKWPNDLVAGGRKLGGVLCEGTVEGARDAFVVAGIGLNVLQEPDGWPPDLRGAATSIAAEGGTPDLPALAARVIAEVSMAAAGGGAELQAAELRELARRDVLRGREVTVDGRPAGRAEGIEPRGALVVRREGAAHHIIAGTIRLAGDDP